MSSDTATKSGRDSSFVFSRFSNFLSNDVAIDLGTANTLVFVKGNGKILFTFTFRFLDSCMNRDSHFLCVHSGISQRRSASPLPGAA